MPILESVGPMAETVDLLSPTLSQKFLELSSSPNKEKDPYQTSYI